MNNSTLVYKTASTILSIAWPFTLPAHRFPSFYCKSCIWWHRTSSICNPENCRAKFKGKKNKIKEQVKTSLNFTKEQRRPTISMLHRNWLKTVSHLTSSQDEKIFWKEFFFHQWQYLSPLPVRSTAGWLAKLQNRTPIPPPLIDVRNSDCPTPVSLL